MAAGLCIENQYAKALEACLIIIQVNKIKKSKQNFGLIEASNSTTVLYRQFDCYKI